MYSTRLLLTDEIHHLRNDFSRLNGSAAEPNPFFAPLFAEHFMDLETPTRDEGYLAVFHGSADETANIVGILPVQQDMRFPFDVTSALTSHFSASAVPVVHENHLEPAMECLAEWIAQKDRYMGAVYFNEFVLDGPSWPPFRNKLEQIGLHYVLLDQIARPCLDAGSAPSIDAYLQRLSGKKRQSLRRKLRKLEGLGTVNHTVHVGADVGKAMDEFLVLEASGWKGRAGTAMKLNAETQSLARDVLSNERFGLTRIEALRLDGRPVAMSIYVGTEKAAFLFKPTYDETYANLSPGQLLYLKTTETLFETRWTSKIDSAVPENDQLRAIWCDRIGVADVLVSTSPQQPAIALDSVAAAISGLNTCRQGAATAYRTTKNSLHHWRRQSGNLMKGLRG